MSANPTRILKSALWIQAALLLVLTSILADSNAWVGAIVAGSGFFLVTLGILAAHKRRIGYLYCYATLVGLWEILALAHILIICGLVVLPPNPVNSAHIIGQKVIENPSDPLKVIMPLLYGLQWGGWCITLVCLVSLRLAKRDVSLATEVQDTRRRHSLEVCRSQSSLGNNQKMGQNLFSFRQSVISPIGGTSTTRSGGDSSPSVSLLPGNGGEGPSVSRIYRSRGTETHPFVSDKIIPRTQTPERAWIGIDRRPDSDSGAIYISGDPRISQVIVTFKDDDGLQSGRCSQPLQGPIAGPSRSSVPDATTISIKGHGYPTMCTAEENTLTTSVKARRNSDVYVLNFSTSGESLSDMIFKPPQGDAQPVPPSQPHPPPLSLSLSREIVAQDTLSSEYRGRDDVPNPARVRSTDTKTSLTLSSDSSSSEAWASSVASNSDGEESEQDHAETLKTATGTESKPRSGSAVALVQETVVSGLAMVSVTPLRIATKENAGHSDNCSTDNPESLVKSTGATMDPKCSGSDERVKHSPLQRIPGLMKVHSELEHPSTFTPYNGADEPIESPPQMQPNSSDSSPSISSLSSAASRREDRCEVNSRRDYGYTKVIVQDGFERIRTPEATSTEPSAYSSQAITAISPSALVLASTSTSATQPPSLPSLQLTATSSTTGSSVTATPSKPVSVSRSKPSIVSPIQYWRSRQSSSSHGVNSSSSSPSSFSQNYITNTFKKKKPLIPTIVIHPDEEGGEPPRVLSQKDIEYLSMMTPAPLRPLIQPWDDISEEDEYDEELTNEGHVYDDRHPHQYHHSQHRKEEYGTILEEDEENSGDFEIHRMEGIDRNDSLGEDYDINALDVPVDLDVELELAASDDNRVTYGYV